MLYIFGGLPGTGKSTRAKLGAVWRSHSRFHLLKSK
ncbi:hypothetical protein A8990_13631 [Paenibacillus taihuensis]|uniref:Uncharacterized protein n=1 Tax=Paenibacillus taihuensis TaxID=1156355 RepID=A0A3D9QVE3_9BACL|nr:hypothetical protein A8990_13631 [Paenibacillus taihuensis]